MMTDHKRRTLLRAALASGFALFLPAAYAKSGKASKGQVKYQDKPKDKQSCSDCLHFVAGDSSCKVVEGKVSPQGWCQLWADKAAKKG